MFTVISFVFHYWYIIAILGGLTIFAAWYSGLLAIRDLAKKLFAFCQTRTGVGLIAIIIGLWVGVKVGDNNLELERERSAKAAIARDLEISQDAKKQAEADKVKLAEHLAGNELKLQKLSDDLESERKKKPTPGKPKALPACRINDEAVRRLLEIK